jgi:hypothetical protein
MMAVVPYAEYVVNKIGRRLQAALGESAVDGIVVAVVEVEVVYNENTAEADNIAAYMGCA